MFNNSVFLGIHSYAQEAGNISGNIPVGGSANIYSLVKIKKWWFDSD